MLTGVKLLRQDEEGQETRAPDQRGADQGQDPDVRQVLVRHGRRGQEVTGIQERVIHDKMMMMVVVVVTELVTLVQESKK